MCKDDSEIRADSSNVITNTFKFINMYGRTFINQDST